MRTTRTSRASFEDISGPVKAFIGRRLAELGGIFLAALIVCAIIALLTWSVDDPSLNHATGKPVSNLLGHPGAIVADLMMQFFGLASLAVLAPLGFMALRLLSARPLTRPRLRFVFLFIGTLAAAALASALPTIGSWPLPVGLGGIIGDLMHALLSALLPPEPLAVALIPTLVSAVIAGLALAAASGIGFNRPTEIDFDNVPDTRPEIRTTRETGMVDDDEDTDEPGFGAIWIGAVFHSVISLKSGLNRLLHSRSSDKNPLATLDARHARRSEPPLSGRTRPAPSEPALTAQRSKSAAPAKRKQARPPNGELDLYTLPPASLLNEAKKSFGPIMSSDALQQNARLLEGVLDDFGVRGEIIQVRPGPVVTLYELEPAPGIKSSRVIGLADDIARSMSAVSARVAVVPGRNAIGIELPNHRRDTVYLRELICEADFMDSPFKLAICLGKTIGGEPVITDLARMPHLLVAGTTGSGKSVAINTMILSLLYRLTPEQCRLIMVDPKMLELSVYDGIPHLLTPVVTDPKKAVVALKWAVREMEERYKKMSKLGVRNIDGFNMRVGEAKTRGEVISRTVQTGFDRDSGEAIFENEVMDLQPLPYLVVIVDEMADLMMVAGKDIEGAIQRLAQMARAAGIHVILATQRPSVDVITGTIKANFPTRISFQVTSKIDSRTILGEQGAEQLLGQGDMLFMAGGGRISRVHGPFVSDSEVEKVVAHLKSQGQPHYLEDITRDDELDIANDNEGTVFDQGSFGASSGDPYDQAIAIVLRDRKASTSYIQRRLQIGYNRAATIMERMEKDGIVGAPNHSGKREILLDAPAATGSDNDH
ncbi:MAG: DNA translocase FtsK [Hyphomicrobiales bacterium]